MEIAVTGTSILSSEGETAVALCEHGLSGKAIKQQINLPLYEKEIDLINTGPRELYRIQKLLLLSFLKASYVAGLKPGLISPERTAIYLGNSYGIEEFKSEFFNHYKKMVPALTSPAKFPFTTANALSSWLSVQTGAKGPSRTFVSGSTSSADAIMAACDALNADECDTAFVGGVSFIDNNLSDDFYDSGFRHEAVGLLVLERMSQETLSRATPLATIKSRQSVTFDQKELEIIRQKQSLLSINDTIQEHINKECSEIVYLANNLGDNYFSYGKSKVTTTMERRKALFLGDIVGNLFDLAGVMSVALGVEALNLSNDAKWSPLGQPLESILCSSISSSGSAVNMLISKI